MKIKILSLLLVGLSLSSCSIKTEGGSIFNLIPKEGKGPITEKSSTAEFDEIKVAQGISAEIIKADTEKVVIYAPSDIIDDILIENVGKQLYLHFKPGINLNTSRIKAKIYARDFSRIEASSSADILVKDKFTQEKTNIKVSSSGSLSGNLEANDMGIDVSSSGSTDVRIWAVNLNVEASSSASINLKGKAKTAIVDVSSSAGVYADQLQVEYANLKASSSGGIDIGVSTELKAVASSSGSINVKKYGNVNVVEQKESSSGSINVK